MDNVLFDFYKSLYFNTGFTPTNPMKLYVVPGDLFQIHRGKMIKLGNVYKDKMVETFDLVQRNIFLDENSWKISSGVRETFRERVSVDHTHDDRSYVNQRLLFKERGSFFFSGESPRGVRITDWKLIEEKLIVKITQQYNAFREIFIVTDVATVDSWTLAISDLPDAELILTSSEDSSGMLGLADKEHARATKSINMHCFEKHIGRSPGFFKAKKLVARQDRIDHFLSNLLRGQSDYAVWEKEVFPEETAGVSTFDDRNFMQSWHASRSNLLMPAEVSVANVLDFFEWENMSLVDIEKLCTSYNGW